MTTTMIPDPAPTPRDGIASFVPDETGLYPVFVNGQLRHQAYIWAADLGDAHEAVLMDPGRVSRYWSETAARDARWERPGVFDDCRLFRIWQGPRYVCVMDIGGGS